MRPITCYSSLIDVGYPNRLRGANNQQNDTALLYLNPGVTGPGQLIQRARGLAVPYFRLYAAGAYTVGIGVRIPNDLWFAGAWVNATTTYTDDTEDAQDAGANDFPLETLTNNDGYIVLSKVKFSVVSLDVGTASVDATDPARAARYSSGGTWAALTTLVLDGEATEYSTGEQLLVFAPPADWEVTTGAEGTGIPAGYYALNVRATTAPDGTAGVADSLSVYMVYFLQTLTAAGSVEYNLAPVEMWMPHGDALVALFSTANAANRVTALVRPRSA